MRLGLPTPAAGQSIPTAGIEGETPLPDFRNLGLIIRTILGVNLFGVVGAVFVAEQPAEVLVVFLEQSFRIEIILLCALAVLAVINPLLKKVPPRRSRWVIVVGVALLAIIWEEIWRRIGLGAVSGWWASLRVGLLSGFVAWVMLEYFALRHSVAHKAVNAAQLAALTARIRPHFLFNSLNAVLSLVRKEPQRAEAALESLAELFRVLMRDPNDLVLLSDEIALCRQYLDLERLRLGDRLQVEWAIEGVPLDTRLPPLMLQPLVENAVYHGIERADDGGILSIGLFCALGAIRIVVENPAIHSSESFPPHAGGHRLALDNIKQRLALYYDMEAGLRVEDDGKLYRVTLTLPSPKGTS